MFKFNFDTQTATNSHTDDQKADEAELGAPAQQVFPRLSTEQPASIALAWDAIALSDSVTILKLRITDEEASKALKDDQVLQNDLIPGKYEGGFKLWEGSIDLARYLVEHIFKNCTTTVHSITVLELGCGHGIPGLVALLAGCTVDFQDYNAEVLEVLTSPTVLANWRANRGLDAPPPPVRYYSGDWGSLGEVLQSDGDGSTHLEYDYIFTAETIYTLEGMKRLFTCIKMCLKRRSGVCIVSAKSFYFGVGGGVAAFRNLVEEDGLMVCETLETIEDGKSNKREIFALKWK